MKSLHRLATAIYFQPWLVAQSTLAAICSQFEAHVGGLPMDMPDDEEEDAGPPPVETSGGIALVRVHGIIGKHLSNLEMMCGGYDIGVFCDQLATLTEDPSITKIVIDFRSPGGTATGVATAAECILAARAAGKKVFAYTSDQCCSAAYWLAASCDEIHAERSAMVGSISAVIAGVDDSAEWAAKGRVRKVLATGDLKAIGMPGKAWTAAEEAHLWTILQSLHTDFTAAVKKCRPAVADDSMRGQAWPASIAPAGVVDSTSFPTLSSFIESVASL